MTLEDAKKLYDLQEDGCRIAIRSGYTSNFTQIYEVDGEYVYSSSVFTNRLLKDVDIDGVRVYRHAVEWDNHLKERSFKKHE